MTSPAQPVRPAAADPLVVPPPMAGLALPPGPLAGRLGLAGGFLGAGIAAGILLVAGGIPWWWQSAWLWWLPAAGAAAAWVAVARLAAAGDLPGARGWRGTRLQVAAWAVAGLAPFPCWWLRAPHSLYLTWGATLAVLATAWFFWETADSLANLARALGWKRFRAAAVAIRVLLYYTQVLPLLASALFVGVAIALRDSLTFHDLPRFLDGMNPWLRHAGLPGAALLALLTLAFSARLARGEPPSRQPNLHSTLETPNAQN